MRDVALSINFYLYNLMTDERQRESHEIVQSPDNVIQNLVFVWGSLLVKFPTFDTRCV